MNQGEDWPREWTARIGRAVQETRKRRGLSAQALSDRCSARGFPIPRNTITNLENGRKEAVPIHEVMVLARELRVAPIDLLFPVTSGDEVAPDADKQLAAGRRFRLGPSRAAGMFGEQSTYDRHAWMVEDLVRLQKREGQTDFVADLARGLEQYRLRMESLGYPLPELPEEVQWWLDPDERGLPNYEMGIHPDDPMPEPPDFPDPEEG